VNILLQFSFQFRSRAEFNKNIAMFGKKRGHLAIMGLIAGADRTVRLTQR